MVGHDEMSVLTGRGRAQSSLCCLRTVRRRLPTRQEESPPQNLAGWHPDLRLEASRAARSECLLFKLSLR